MYLRLLGSLLLVLSSPAGFAEAAPSKGDPMPRFDLQSVDGKPVSSQALGDSGLTILTFLSLDSKPSRELAVALSGIVHRHGRNGLMVIAIAADPPDKLREFATSTALGFSVCSDPDRAVLRSYGAEHVVPMTYIVGPGRRIAEVVAGGGAATQQVLLAIAEKELARGNAQTASELYGSVVQKDPKNVNAQAGRAFALLKEGKLEQAEQAFESVESLGGSAAGLAAEGLAEVALQEGDLDGATAALEKAPAPTAYQRVVRGEIAVRQGKLEQARKELEAASTGEFAFAWQKGVTFNNLARITRETGRSDRALEAYDEAIAAEPFLVEARSNKAVALEKAGRAKEAKETLEVARSIAPSDQIVTTLLRRLEESERQKIDLERQKLTNQLVSELVAAYRGGKLPHPPPDEWTPRALVVSFLDIENRLGALSREGLSDAFLLHLTRVLQESGRIRVVEREIVDKLLVELKLGSSELADPATRLKLGRVLAASVIGTGGWSPAAGTSQLQLRLIDTETTDIRATLLENLARPAEVATFAGRIAEKIASSLTEAYPLRGKIASVEKQEIIVGIGRKHGATKGLQLRVVEDGEPVKVDGEVIGYKRRTIGTLELTDVEDGFAYAKVVSGGRFAKGQHVLEAR